MPANLPVFAGGLQYSVGVQRTLVFIPIHAEELAAITGTVTLEQRLGFSPTLTVYQDFGLAPEATEDAEYAALLLASVSALSQFGQRLVLVANVPAATVSVDETQGCGAVQISTCPASAITSWFCEAPGVDTSAAASAAAQQSVDQAWEIPEVQELISEHDLLWNDRVEYRG